MLVVSHQQISHDLAGPSFAIYVAFRPIPDGHQAQIHFLFVWPTPVLQYMLVVGLFQVYSHQQIFSSSGRPQLCNICWLSACPSFTAINTLSHHAADPSYAICVGCWPVLTLRPTSNFLIIRLTSALQYMLFVSLSQLWHLITLYPIVWLRPCVRHPFYCMYSLFRFSLSVLYHHQSVSALSDLSLCMIT